MEHERLTLAQMIINQLECYLVEQFDIEILDCDDNKLTFHVFKENFQLQITHIPLAKLEKK